MWLGWGSFSRRSVLSLVSGIWEDPSVRDLLASGREEGRPVMAPGSSLTITGRERLPTPVLLPGEFHGQKSLECCNPWGCKESDMTERLTLSLKPLESFDEAGCVELQGVHPQAHCDSFCVCVCAGHALAAARYPNSLTSGGTLKWKCGVLTTGLPGKPHVVVLTQSLVCTSQWECLHRTFCMKSTCLV